MRAAILIGLEYLGIIEFDEYPFDREAVERALRIWTSIGRLFLLGVIVLVETRLALLFGM